LVTNLLMMVQGLLVILLLGKTPSQVQQLDCLAWRAARAPLTLLKVEMT